MITADEALERLKLGNRQFVDNIETAETLSKHARPHPSAHHFENDNHVHDFQALYMGRGGHIRFIVYTGAQIALAVMAS